MAQAWGILSNGEVIKDLSSKLNLCEYEVFPNRDITKENNIQTTLVVSG